MAVVRTISGAFAVIEGDVAGALARLSSEGVSGDHRIVGFSVSGTEVLIMYAL